MGGIVQQLRHRRFKVRIGHFRYFKGFRKPRLMRDCPDDPKPRGGLTVVQITSPEGEEFEARIKCSRDDNYNKKQGVRMAVARAFEIRDQQRQSALPPAVLEPKLPSIDVLHALIVEGSEQIKSLGGTPRGWGSVDV